MPDLFKEILPSILQTKKDVINDDNERDYLPYIINKALSFHYDCVIRANQMNLSPGLDRKLQYHFLLNSIRAWKRPFQKWQKLEKNDKIELIKEYYNYSNEKAKATLSLLSEEQFDYIRKSLSRGGLRKS